MLRTGICSWMFLVFFLSSLSLSSVATATITLQSARQQWAGLLREDPQLLAPKRYREAQKSMQALEDAVTAKRDTQKWLEDAENHLQILRKAMERVQSNWRDLLEVRRQALQAGAKELAPNALLRADNVLVSAARKLETGREDSAQRQVESLSELYLQAKREAEREALVGASYRRLSAAKKQQATQFAPRSYTRALDAVNRVDKLMKNLAHDDPELLAASKAAKEAVNHHLYLLHHLQGTCDIETRPQLESEIIEWEDALQRTLAIFGLQPHYELGMRASLERLEFASRRLSEEHSETQRLLKARASQVDSLENVIDGLKEDIGDLQGRVANLSPYEDESRLLQRIQSRFTQNEGRVLLENRDIILRLHGLIFESGDADIPPEAYPLLDKVIQTVRDLPGAYLIVEGHTDSQGRESTNMALSKARADAVRDYLLQNGAADPAHVNTIGYGSSRPVSSNATPEGRALNRRIEITLSRAG